MQPCPFSLFFQSGVEALFSVSLGVERVQTGTYAGQGRGEENTYVRAGNGMRQPRAKSFGDLGGELLFRLQINAGKSSPVKRGMERGDWGRVQAFFVERGSRQTGASFD